MCLKGGVSDATLVRLAWFVRVGKSKALARSFNGDTSPQSLPRRSSNEGTHTLRVWEGALPGLLRDEELSRGRPAGGAAQRYFGRGGGECQEPSGPGTFLFVEKKPPEG